MRHATRLRFPSGYVTIKRGSEGPRHDPYSYTEIQVERGGVATTYHLGLGVWIRTPGDVSYFDDSPEGPLLFQKLTGYTPRYWERLFEAEAHRRWRALSPDERYQAERAEEYDDQLMRYAL